MEICYVDEAGGADEVLRKAIPSSTPVFVLVGVIVPTGQQMRLQWDYLQLKKEMNPRLESARLSDVISTEVKGSDLRADLRSESRRRNRRAQTFIARTLALLERHRCHIIGRVTVKEVERPMEDRAIYSSQIRWLCNAYNQYLEAGDAEGIMVLDSRTKVKNTPSSLGVTTTKFRTGGDPLPMLREVPVFGHSDSHVGLQIADIIASAILFPASCDAYCQHLAWNHHSHPAYGPVRAKFGRRLGDLQYRYFDEVRGHWCGGIWVTGPGAGQVRSADIFTPPPSPQLPL